MCVAWICILWIYFVFVCIYLYFRCLLHPGLHPLHPDRQVDAGPRAVQALAGHGLPALLRVRLQHRPHQLRPLPVRHQSGEQNVRLTPEQW